MYIKIRINISYSIVKRIVYQFYDSRQCLNILLNVFDDISICRQIGMTYYNIYYISFLLFSLLGQSNQVHKQAEKHGKYQPRVTARVRVQGQGYGQGQGKNDQNIYNFRFFPRQAFSSFRQTFSFFVHWPNEKDLPNKKQISTISLGCTARNIMTVTMGPLSSAA